MRPLFFTFLVLLGMSHMVRAQLVNKLTKDTIEINEFVARMEGRLPIMTLYTGSGLVYGQCISIADSGVWLHSDTAGIIDLSQDSLIQFYRSNEIDSLIYGFDKNEINPEGTQLAIQFVGSVVSSLFVYSIALIADRNNPQEFLISFPAFFVGTFYFVSTRVEVEETVSFQELAVISDKKKWTKKLEIYPEYQGQALETTELIRKSSLYQKKLDVPQLRLNASASFPQFLSSNKYQNPKFSVNPNFDAEFYFNGNSSLSLGLSWRIRKVLDQRLVKGSINYDLDQDYRFRAFNFIYRYSLLKVNGVSFRPLDVSLGVGLNMTEVSYDQSIWVRFSPPDIKEIEREKEQWLVGPIIDLRANRFFTPHLSIFIEWQQRILPSLKYEELRLETGNPDVPFLSLEKGAYQIGGSFVYFGFAYSI